MPYCLIFPGQGTQFPGMSAGLDMKWTGDDALVDLMENGPEDVLRQTTNAQRAIFAVSLKLLERSGLDNPAVVMGHSLGEYTALFASGALSARECLDLVSFRASVMEDAGRAGKGVMAAVMGMTARAVGEALDGLDGVWVANINMPGQVVISGYEPSVQEASGVLKSKGARRIIPLNVAAASHCPLMESAAKALREHLKGVAVRKPKAGIVFNAVAREESDPERIKDLLARQLVSPVQWEDSVRYTAEKGINRFIEIGPKSVLGPMVKKIVPDAEVEVIAHDGH